jgi:hypothetical protein
VDEDVDHAVVVGGDEVGGRAVEGGGPSPESETFSLDCSGWAPFEATLIRSV